MILYIIICIFWGATAIQMMVEVIPTAKNLSFWKQTTVGIVIMISAPVMLIAQAIEAILGEFLGEDWSDNDETKFRH